MSERIPFRLGDLLEHPPPCVFLDESEIVDWLEDRLPMERRKEWLDHARTCPSCIEIVDDHTVFQGLTTNGLAVASEARAFEKRDPQVRKALPIAGSPGRSWRSHLVWLVPSVTAAALALVFLLPRGLLIADIESVPLVPPPAVRGYSAAEEWKRIEAAWEREDMRTAETILEAAVVKNPESADLYFYLGIARLETEDWAGAIEALRAADTLQSDRPSETTLWMLATAHDRAGNRPETCATLQSLAELEGRRVAEASRILAESCR